MNTLLSNILARFISEWEVYHKHQTELASAKKQQLMHSMQIIYDEAASMVHEQPELVHFLNQCQATIASIDPKAAAIHFSTHNQTDYAN
jgi:hypothetical protein